MAAHNVAIKIITGDNFLVTKKIADEIGLPIMDRIMGDAIAAMHELEFKKKVEDGECLHARQSRAEGDDHPITPRERPCGGVHG